MRLTLHVWRQAHRSAPGRFVTYELDGVSPNMSFLEMLDLLNERLIERGEEPVAFDHDCREGICGACGVMINGIAHGKDAGTTTCQLHMRRFRDGEEIRIEPWRARAFPIVKDLVVDRSSFDRIIAAGGFVSANAGSAPDANAIPIGKDAAESAFAAAACIGCGACVAACPNAAAMLFVGAKVAHLNRLPQGRIESPARVLAMVAQMEREGFGNCSNFYECEAVCPKEISVDVIAEMNRLHAKASLTYVPPGEEQDGAG
ncbi:MAG TPA: succinate dehydrogenase/fumarate reductase iron-sulfur subunit [Planctomycetota bacterium]|nr:succinate dehydrogenase/fumarate reductase iron-sulfur subunit [Planctomycetota bacterium]